MSASEIEGVARGDGHAPVQLTPTGDELKQAIPIKAARTRTALTAQAHQYAARARTQAEVGRLRASAIVQERPLVSVGTALGVGLLAGLLAGACAARALAEPRHSRPVAEPDIDAAAVLTPG